MFEFDEEADNSITPHLWIPPLTLPLRVANHYWLWDHRRKSSEGSHYGGRVSCVDCRWGIYHQFILIVVKLVSEKCGITGHHLFNRPTFTTVFNNLIHWIEPVWQKHDKVVSHIIQVLTYCEHCDYFTHFLVLVAHNWFLFDFSHRLKSNVES